MNPIVNPWWFHMFDVLNAADIVFLILCVLSGFATLILGIVWRCLKYDTGEDCGFKKPTILTAILFAICLMFTVAIPSEKTMYRMAAASIVTPNNLEAAGETATDIIDYIVESVDKLIEDDTVTETEAE